MFFLKSINNNTFIDRNFLKNKSLMKEKKNKKTMSKKEFSIYSHIKKQDKIKYFI